MLAHVGLLTLGCDKPTTPPQQREPQPAAVAPAERDPEPPPEPRLSMLRVTDSGGCVVEDRTRVWLVARLVGPLWRDRCRPVGGRGIGGRRI
ncbi:hypothetical protein [Enhygromyxa salina]|uniref:Uncharacterized protein n=1 Tax=Enhygromyxa salina TaxID=215803 RepID=A0A2S9YP31_9BACT|nr:hypothetical protein [Enhygromyxa salina]PRQ06836.1 hypothetical protein ENSA7_34960 [Enhygromyxa salina]